MAGPNHERTTYFAQDRETTTNLPGPLQRLVRRLTCSTREYENKSLADLAGAETSAPTAFFLRLGLR
jgi:hypothetical protein